MPETIVVFTDAELSAAFDSASDGDRIELAANGVFNAPDLRGRHFDTQLTITSQNPDMPAVISTRLHLQDLSNVTVSNLEIARTSLAPSGTEGTLTLQAASQVTLRDISVSGYIPTAAEGQDPGDPDTRRGDVIAGYGYGMGVRVLGSSDVTLDGLEISDLRVGMRLERIDGLTVTGLDIHDVREGINLFDATDTIIEDSHFHDFNPWWYGNSTYNDHPDMIQYWGTASSIGVHGLTIRNNLFDQSDGWTQTIFGEMASAAAGVTAEDFTISGNIIINAHLNGIRLHDVDGAQVIGNLLIPNGDEIVGDIDFPQILFYDTTNGRIADNVAVAMQNGAITNVTSQLAASNNIEVTGNLALSRDAGAADYWGTALASWQNTPALFDPGASDYLDAITQLIDGTAEAHFETGVISVTQKKASQWHSVSFDSAIENARVIMGPIEANGAHPAVARVRNVTETGFQFQIDEWDYLDGAHTTETISWIAGPDGSHQLANGVALSFGQVSLQDEIVKTVGLNGFGAAPAVFAQVTSTNDSAAVTTRITSVKSGQFKLQMQEEEAADGLHASEQVDWLAINYGGEGAQKAGKAGDAGINLAANPDDFVFLAGMQTAKGLDPAALRYETSQSGTRLFVEEEASADEEIAHTSETVAVLSLASGSYDLL